MWIYSKWTACLLSLTWARGWTTSAAALLSMAACSGCRAAVTAASSRSSICFLSGSVVAAKWAWKGWKHQHEHTRIKDWNIQVTFNDLIIIIIIIIITDFYSYSYWCFWEFCPIWFLFVVCNFSSAQGNLSVVHKLLNSAELRFGCKELNMQQLIDSLNSCQILNLNL